MNGVFDLIQWGSILALVGLHAFALWYGTMSGWRGLRTAAAYLAMFDWTLMMGATAGRSVATEDTPFWSLHTIGWGFLGASVLFLPAWLLFRYGLRWSGIFLLPVVPTERGQRKQAGRTLRAYMWGSNYPFYREEDGELRELVKGGTKLPEGGPGFVMTSSHYAIPITVGTSNQRVGGQGLVFTSRRERPLPPVDLRPQICAKSVRTLTRDGIPVKVMMYTIFQIDRREARGKGFYPFDPQAVFAAVHAQGVWLGQEEQQRELGWDQIVVDRAVDLLRDAIAQTLLDRLLESDEGDVLLPRERLSAEVKEGLAQAVEAQGIQVLGIRLGNIEVEDEEVLLQRAQSWKAGWERRRLEKETRGEVEAIRLIAEARADAQRQMIVAITEAFQQLADTGTPVPAHVIALRFIDVLEDMTTSPPAQELLPETVQAIPSQLRYLVGQTAAGDGDQSGQ